MEPLSYLFECHFTDGTMLQQTQEDVSSTDPSRSAFYDVMQRLDGVESFGLFNDEHTIAVDLRDGHFEIDKIPFLFHGGNAILTLNGITFQVEGDEIPQGDHQYRLVYFRRHFHTRVVGAVTEDILSTEHDIEYHLGWQTTIDGKNYQQTIAVM